MGLYRTQTTNNDDEDEREFTPALNILSQMIAITTFLCFYISRYLGILFSKDKTDANILFSNVQN